MEFVGVSGVRIPEGDVSKITESATGRVLWEKEKKYLYPMYFMYISRGHKTTGLTVYFPDPSGKTAGGYAGPGASTVDSSLKVSSGLSLGSMYKSPSPGLLQLTELNTEPEVKSGDRFYACYSEKESDELNIPVSAKKMEDAEWEVSSMYICAMSYPQLLLQIRHITPSYSVSYGLIISRPSPVKISPSSGGATQITSTVSGFSEYSALYESYKGMSGYRDKSEAPYLHGSVSLSFRSSSFNRMIGRSDTTNCELTLYFTIPR